MGGGMAEEEEEEPSVNNFSITANHSSWSTKELHPMGSPLGKKRKSQYELNDPRSPSLKHKFRDRLTGLNDESSATESIFINRNGDIDMVSEAGEQCSAGNTRSLLGYCIEVDSERGIEKQSRRNIFWDHASTSGSSSRSIHSYACSSSNTTDTRLQHCLGNETPDDPNPVGAKRTCSVLEADDDFTAGLVKDDMDCSDAANEDEMLYSNGVGGLLLLPDSHSDGQDGHRAGAKKLTIDQEFEKYFSMLML